MSNPIVDVKIVANVFIKTIHFVEAGDFIKGPVHIFDSITLLASGKVLLKHDSGEQEFVAPHAIFLPKGLAHQFNALSDNTVISYIHAIRNGDNIEDIADPNITPEQIYELIKKYPIAQD